MGLNHALSGGALPSIRRPDRNLIDGFGDTNRTWEGCVTTVRLADGKIKRLVGNKVITDGLIINPLLSF